MEDHETVLSEVHVGIPGVSSTATNIISRFEFAVPRVATSPLVRPQLTRSFSKDSNEMDTEMSAQTISIGYAVGTTESESTTMNLLKLENPSGDMNEIDKYSKADETTAGDQSPPRKARANEVILIEHHMATHLVKVGFQVFWCYNIQEEPQRYNNRCTIADRTGYFYYLRWNLTSNKYSRFRSRRIKHFVNIFRLKCRIPNYLFPPFNLLLKIVCSKCFFF